MLLCAQVPGARPTTGQVEDQLLAQLKDGDWIMRWQAMEELAGRKSAAAVGPLKAIVADKAQLPFVRGRAMVALARIDGPAALELAAAMAGDAVEITRAAAVEALGLIDSPRARQIVQERLADSAPAVRAAAVVAHARLNGPAAWAVVQAKLSDPDPQVARAAVGALPLVGGEPARAKLKELLASSQPSNRAAAAAAVEQWRAADLLPALLQRTLVEKDPTVVAATEEALAAFDPKDLTPPLRAALADKDTSLDRLAIKLLTLRRSKAGCDGVAAALARLNEKDPAVLADAIGVLAGPDADTYLSSFTAHLRHERADVRKAAIAALGRCKSADLFALLRDSLIDADVNVRFAAYQTLRKCTTGSPKDGLVTYLAAPLASADPAVFRFAIDLLRDRLTRRELPAAIAALDRFLSGSDPALRDLAATALAANAGDDGLALIARAEGFLMPWMTIGPFTFDPADGGSAIDAAFPPEQEFDFDKTYTTVAGRSASWSICQATRLDGAVDLAKAYEDDLPPNLHRVAYAATDVVSTGRKDVQMTVTTTRSAAVWVNGARVELTRKGNDLIGAAKLNDGANRVLVKVATADRKEWSFRVQVRDGAGKRVEGMGCELPKER